MVSWWRKGLWSVASHLPDFIRNAQGGSPVAIFPFAPNRRCKHPPPEVVITSYHYNTICLRWLFSKTATCPGRLRSTSKCTFLYLAKIQSPRMVKALDALLLGRFEHPPNLCRKHSDTLQKMREWTLAMNNEPTCPGFDTTAQYSSPGSLCQESDV